MSRISSVIWMRGDHSGRPEVCTVTVFGRAAPSCASSCLIERSWPIKRISDRAIGRVLDVEQAHPFVGMQLADLRQLSLPRLWGRRSPRGSLVHPRRACRRVKFLAASWYGRAEGFVSPLGDTFASWRSRAPHRSLLVAGPWHNRRVLGLLVISSGASLRCASGAFAPSLALLWVAHVGFDRVLGYGLKYDQFTATHLGRIGRTR